MKKITLILFLVFGTCLVLYAQKSAQDNYFDFTVYRTTRGDEVCISKAKALLEQKDQLTAKQILNVHYHLGRMYEEVGDVENALVQYAESVKGEPNYSVSRRALGFIYLSKTKPFVKQMNEATAAKNADANSKAFENYKAMVMLALPHLEKYQACENDEETLTIISNLYKSIKQPQSITTLHDRLKSLAQNCVSLLEDE